MKTICIYHTNCSDGFTAAWVVYDAYKHDIQNTELEFHAASYGEPYPDVKDKNVIIVDFSYDRKTMIEMSKEAKHIIVLDHHKTAQDNLLGLEPELHCPSEIIFDMNKSGCMLAWEYYYPKEQAHQALEVVEDRDLWRFKKPYTKEISAYIFSLEQTFPNWDYLMDDNNLAEAIDSGSALLRKQDKDVQALFDGLVEYQSIQGYRVAVANVPWIFASDLGNKMCLECEDISFSLCYYKDNTGKYNLSFRSTDELSDASIVAESLGGGGHRNACGAKVDKLPW